MKNYVAFLLYLCFCFGFPIKGYAQDYGMKYSCYYDGYWGAWHDCVYYYSIYGNYGGFNFYYSSRHPSDYLFRFQINSYMPPSKDEIKKHWKRKRRSSKMSKRLIMRRLLKSSPCSKKVTIF